MILYHSTNSRELKAKNHLFSFLKTANSRNTIPIPRTTPVTLINKSLSGLSMNFNNSSKIAAIIKIPENKNNVRLFMEIIILN